MDFFLDSGIFLGICDPIDKHNEACKKLLVKYPIHTNNYYTAEMVKIELRRKRLQKIKKGYNQTVLRRIEQYINTWFRLMKVLVKYEEENYPDFVYLVEDIERITNYNRNDAIIVANALVWSYERDLDNPTLVTTDFEHLVKKSDKIIEQAELRFSGAIPLKIKAVWDI
jgi:predicted nucleic acid-binding protein